MIRSPCVLLFVFLILSPLSRAADNLIIEIIGGGAQQIPIAIVPFGNESAYPLGLTGVIGADLQRSGLFKLVDYTGIAPRPVDPQQVRYAEWKERGAEAMVIGNILPRANGEVEVQFRLLDVIKQTQLSGFSYVIAPAQFRKTAHRIADVIYEKLTGDVGVFSTQIAYVSKNGPRHELQIADADGYNAQTIVTSNEPILSPAWSPDGSRIAYVSFENRQATIYVQSLATGRRQVLANFKGTNSAPSWAPDGKRLAVTLTKDGISQIYLINADGGAVTRLTDSGSIETEPFFSSDGLWLAFVSTRGGSPQIYRLNLATRAIERLTVDGSTYNTAPRFSPDGKSVIFIRREGGRFNVMLQDIATRQVVRLTDGTMDDSPSFAPNGKIIIYESEIGRRGILATVSSDGRVKQRLLATSGDIRNPAWGPLPKNP